MELQKALVAGNTKLGVQLRREVRKRLNLSGPDPLAAQLDAELGISRHKGFLQLHPETARLRPKE